MLRTITIAALGLFVQVDVMTSGGPQDATSTLVYHAVRKGYREQDSSIAGDRRKSFPFRSCQREKGGPRRACRPR